jgi:hypothetical protein
LQDLLHCLEEISMLRHQSVSQSLPLLLMEVTNTLTMQWQNLHASARSSTDGLLVTNLLSRLRLECTCGGADAFTALSASSSQALAKIQAAAAAPLLNVLSNHVQSLNRELQDAWLAEVANRRQARLALMNFSATAYAQGRPRQRAGDYRLLDRAASSLTDEDSTIGSQPISNKARGWQWLPRLSPTHAAIEDQPIRDPVNSDPLAAVDEAHSGAIKEAQQYTWQEAGRASRRGTADSSLSSVPENHRIRCHASRNTLADQDTSNEEFLPIQRSGFMTSNPLAATTRDSASLGSSNLDIADEDNASSIPAELVSQASLASASPALHETESLAHRQATTSTMRMKLQTNPQGPRHDSAGSSTQANYPNAHSDLGEGILGMPVGRAVTLLDIYHTAIKEESAHVAQALIHAFVAGVANELYAPLTINTTRISCLQSVAMLFNVQQRKRLHKHAFVGHTCAGFTYLHG